MVKIFFLIFDDSTPLGWFTIVGGHLLGNCTQHVVLLY